MVGTIARHGPADSRFVAVRVTAEAFEEIEGLDNIDRSRLGLTFSHRPNGWLNHRFTLGGDFTNNGSSRYFP